ncbi:SLBB domain-containing protein, partial [Planctomycetota bacterium]
PQQRGPQRIEIDLVRLLLDGDSRADRFVEPSWTVQVPRADEFVVAGYVQKPGAFLYRRPTTVLQALAMAGGLHERLASPSEVTIKRPARQGRGIEIHEVDVEDIVNGEAQDVPIFAGDSVEVGRTWAWAIYTEIVDRLTGFANVGLRAGGI